MPAASWFRRTKAGRVGTASNSDWSGCHKGKAELEHARKGRRGLPHCSALARLGYADTRRGKFIEKERDRGGILLFRSSFILQELPLQSFRAWRGHASTHAMQRMHSVACFFLRELLGTSTSIGQTCSHLPQETQAFSSTLIRNSEE